MTLSSKRRSLLLLIALGLAACSASKDKGATGGGGNAGSNGDGGSANGGDSGAPNGGGNQNGNGNGSGGDAATVTCYDNDKDSFGIGCSAGPDCDDMNADLGGYEICDGKDNDCDGKVDQFIKDVCTKCDESCTPTNEPPNDTGWTPIKDKEPEDVQDVIIDNDGALTLSRDESQAHAIWVANTSDLDNENSLPVFARGSVSKLDSKTNRELARYISVLPSMVDDMGDSRPRPSRTAVDQRFDAYVANRALDNDSSQQTVTKYADAVADCLDRNGNGMIETSSDVDGDGKINTDLTLPAGMREFWGADDECILWTVKVGSKGGFARALAVGIAGPDGDVGDVYVGLFRAEQVCKISHETGALIGTCTSTPGFRSYGAASDAKGRVWFASRGGSNNGIGFVDSNMAWTFITGMPQCGNNNADPYGMTVDADNRVYFAASNCSTEGVFRYDHDNAGLWEKVSIPSGGTGRGVAVDREHLWVAISGNGTESYRGGSDRIEQFDLGTLTHLATHNMPNGRSPVGIGVSFDGSIWAINQDHGGGSDPFTGDVGIATRLDTAIPSGQAGHWIEWPVGKDPYTYSDFIGFGLNTFADPKGFYRFVIEGCGAMASHWRGVQVDAQTPAGTSVVINVRSANSKADLAKAEWHGPYTSPAPLTDVPDGAFLEVEVVLATDDPAVAPRVFGVEVIKECEDIIQ